MEIQDSGSNYPIIDNYVLEVLVTEIVAQALGMHMIIGYLEFGAWFANYMQATENSAAWGGGFREGDYDA